MYLDILKLQFKAFRRSPAFNQNLLSTIVMGLIALYFLLMFIGLGAAIPYFAEDISPDKEGPILIGSYYLNFLIYLFVIKFVFQNFGFQQFKELIIQKIPKRTIIQFILLKSATHWTNVIPLLGILAYLISASIKVDYDMNIITHGLVMISLLYYVNYLAFWFNKQLPIKKKWTYLFLAVLILIQVLDYKGFLALSPILEYIYSFLTRHLAFAIIPFLGVVINYYLSYRSTLPVAYLEDLTTNTEPNKTMNLKSGIFSRFGNVGELMELELKLILRNKRSRQMALMLTPFFISYPLIMDQQSESFMFMVAIICTGAFALTYGQYLLSWNCDHFDLLLVKMEQLRDVFKAKYYLQVLSIVSTSLLASLWGFYNHKFFYLMPAMMIYNIGVVSFMYMFLASYNSKKINTNKSAYMNYEGTSIGMFLIIIPIIAIPLLLNFGFKAMGYMHGGIIATTFLGILGILFHKSLITASSKLFNKHKYKIGAAFRQKSEM